MKRLDLQVTKRVVSGKGGARSTRRAGQVPGIIYGEGQDPMAIAIDRHTIEKALYSSDNENVLVYISVEGESGETLTLVRETQHHPLTGALEHLDFRRVSVNRPIRTMVPVHTTGTAKGMKEGGILEQQLREVELECLPLEIPDNLVVDITEIEIGHSMHVSDLPSNPNYKILTAGERALVMVVAPKIETVPGAATAEGAAAEEAGGDAKGEESSEG